MTVSLALCLAKALFMATGPKRPPHRDIEVLNGPTPLTNGAVLARVKRAGRWGFNLHVGATVRHMPAPQALADAIEADWGDDPKATLPAWIDVLTDAERGRVAVAAGLGLFTGVSHHDGIDADALVYWLAFAWIDRAGERNTYAPAQELTYSAGVWLQRYLTHTADRFMCADGTVLMCQPGAPSGVFQHVNVTQRRVLRRDIGGVGMLDALVEADILWNRTEAFWSRITARSPNVILDPLELLS
jgi:hypothetical protein